MPVPPSQLHGSTAVSEPSPAVRSRVQTNFNEQAFMGLLGVRLTALGPGACELRLRYTPEVGQQQGFFHGGVIGAVADVAAGLARFTLAPVGASVFTVEFKVNLLTPGAGDALVARGTVVGAGKTLAVSQAVAAIVGPRGERACAVALQIPPCAPPGARGPRAGSRPPARRRAPGR